MAYNFKDQRVGVFVDVQNMYYSAKNLYNAKVNFAQILKAAVRDRSLIRAIAYVIKADVKEEQNFFDALEKIGFEVRAKDLQIFAGGAKKGDWDIGLAMDSIEFIAFGKSCSATLKEECDSLIDLDEDKKRYLISR